MSTVDVIGLSSETAKIFPFVADKLVIDFVNGLDAAQDLNAAGKQHSGLAARFLDGVSGKSALRQQHINDHLMNGLEACRQLFGELSRDVEKHSVAISRISNSLANCQRSVAALANYTAEFKDEFNGFVAQTQREFADLRNELSEQKRLIRAEQQLTYLTDKWAAGGFDALPPIARAFAVIDTLNWGAFGERMRLDGDRSEFMEHLRHKLVIRLSHDLKVEPQSVVGVLKDDWTRLPENASAELMEVLQFQGDWCLRAPKVFRATLLATQPQQPEYAALVPSIPTVKQVVKHLVAESFEVNAYAR
ncbi:hypothetical protein L1281_000473 [Neisseria sp. HSC-16F19]|nr:YjcZ-like family protein [Neisseria sp. HSC-16F19]MCP2039894.1 hypothetical protein [Neisseria sp. HSC-16F19]